MNKRYQLIVFDWDGTVMDSTAVIVRSMQAACRDVGLPAPSDELARHVIGLGLVQALQQAVPEAEPHQYEQLVERYRHHFLGQSDAIPLYEGAAETIAELHGAGYLLAVATGKNRHGLQRALASSGLGRYFHATRTADVSFSKPHPAMLQELLDELDVQAQRALMVGDTTHDLQMALNAGVDAVAVAHGAHPEQALRELAPLALVQDFNELRGWLRTNA